MRVYICAYIYLCSGESIYVLGALFVSKSTSSIDCIEP